MAKTNKKTTKNTKKNRIYKNNIDKNYNSISMILNTSNTCMMPLFSQIHIFAVYTETIFKNLHFETYFPKFALAGPQNAFVV